MIRRPFRLLFATALCALALSAPPTRADEHGDAPARAQGQNAAPQGGNLLALLPPDSVTSHTLATPAGPLAYTATAGTLDLYGQGGERIAAVFYTAYVAKDAGRDRPLTFVFNGGPGAASAYLHLGLVGPKILDFGPTGHDGAAARLVDNPQSWLAFTDLVIIDPVGTGWSRAAKADDAKNFYGVNADAETMAKVIALYVAHNDRGNSPKYLLGESYGGFRAAKTAARLREQQGIMVSGIVMLSPLIDGAVSVGSGGSGNSSLHAALELPSMAAAELERKGAFTPQALAEAEHFALTDYLTALTGPPPPEPASRELYARVAALTGLAPEAVTRSRGFVRRDYIKQVRERDHKVVSAYDAALAMPDPYPEMLDEHGGDPVLAGFTRAFGGAFAAYARAELGFKCDMTYTLLAHLSWQWGSHEQGSMTEASATDELRETLALSPSFRLLIAHGTSDLVTPYAANKYVIDHLPSSLTEGRVALKLYRGGHMLYTNAASRLAFTADARAFYAGDGATTGRN
jgi:carboxypeptidase C (cathepsin A)